ncbi:hypothetical protein BDV06DRAFT_168782 [Aspergillus oleicola]
MKERATSQEACGQKGLEPGVEVGDGENKATLVAAGTCPSVCAYLKPPLCSRNASKVHPQRSTLSTCHAFYTSSVYSEPVLNHGQISQASFMRFLGELSFLGCEMFLVSPLRPSVANLRLGVGWPRLFPLSIFFASPFPNLGSLGDRSNSPMRFIQRIASLEWRGSYFPEPNAPYPFLVPSMDHGECQPTRYLKWVCLRRNSVYITLHPLIDRILEP